MTVKKSLLFVFLLLFTLSCGSDDPYLTDQVLSINKVQSVENLNALLKTAEQIVVKVYFEAGADPYIGNNQASGEPYWNLLEDNISAAAGSSTRQLSLTVPKNLSEMVSIGVKNKDSWNADEIKALAAELGHVERVGNQANVIVLFLNGFFKMDDGTVSPGVIGVSVTGTTIITIFKDVIRNVGFLPDDEVSVYVEQSTLIHEFGHAFGLVNNGVPLTSDHHDVAHGAHCTNPRCVMYWQNEGSRDLLEFARQQMVSGSNVMYGQECIDDLNSFQGESSTNLSVAPQNDSSSDP